MSVSQANEITMRPDNSIYTYHEALDPHQTTQAVGEYVAKKYGKQWYFLTSDYAYGWQMTDGFRRKGKEYKVRGCGRNETSFGNQRLLFLYAPHSGRQAGCPFPGQLRQGSDQLGQAGHGFRSEKEDADRLPHPAHVLPTWEAATRPLTALSGVPPFTGK